MQNTVAELGYTMATPIQAGSLPFAMAGRDVIGQAQTGSGKTAAFGIPIIERLDPRDGPVQALVLCPTRELAVQVHEELTRLGKRHELRSVAIYGGGDFFDRIRHLVPLGDIRHVQRPTGRVIFVAAALLVLRPPAAMAQEVDEVVEQRADAELIAF